MGERFCFFVLFYSNDEMWVPKNLIGKDLIGRQVREVKDHEEFNIRRSLDLVV